MTDRRFSDKPSLDPGAVRGLPKTHLAMVENRTLFPSTVVEVTADFSDRLLVSGVNNRKLGETVSKGRFKGYKLFGLSLEERATCPSDCDARAFCYGNGMQMARRHRIGDPEVFFKFLEDEINTILADPIDGLLVRLHVLGDFPSVDYMAFWADMLSEHERLACYGYTHRLPKQIGGDEIGDAVESLKSQYRERFRIRWSWHKPLPDGAYVIDHVPSSKTISHSTAEAIVCPAQTDDTACCASCGFCWEWNASGKSIAFIKHGPKSLSAVIEKEVPVEAPPVSPADDIRPVEPIPIASKGWPIVSRPPVMRTVSPTDLKVEKQYQRDLSGKSVALIRKIVQNWDWTKFKPPVCAETEKGLFVIDGQHTAIAAATHPEITQIPVMIVSEQKQERRAAAFVSHNRDRLNMSAFQIFYGEVAAGVKDAKQLLVCVMKAGATIPRAQPLKGYAKSGQLIAVGEARRILTTDGPDVCERVLRIAVKSRIAPIGRTVVRGLRLICKEPHFSATASLSDEQIAAAIATLKNVDSAARIYAAEAEQNVDRACAVLIANACKNEVAA